MLYWAITSVFSSCKMFASSKALRCEHPVQKPISGLLTNEVNFYT